MEEKSPMSIYAPHGLHYPITITDISRKRGEDVKRSQQLFTYWYESLVTEDNKWGETNEVKRRFHASFAAAIDGVIEKWHVKPKSVVQRPGVLLVEITEPCTHETQFGGMCAECGKDMTEVDYLTKELDTGRASVNMTHDNTALLVSRNEARRAEEESKKRLLESKKLSLIVDLDQTVIHTTCERTIAEWQSDPENPNYEFVKDVQGFQLADDNVAHVASNWYYVKMRPGLRDFFDRMSELYEMHIYTMATRAYAQAVAQIIDPERRYFGDRILSRDENYTDKLKSLKRLFPNNTDMVVIIDDRADIWSYSEHLVRVPVFNFFPGAGDINASFLPKQVELVTSAPPDTKASSSTKPKDKDADAASPVTVAGGKPIELAIREGPNGTDNELENQMLAMGAAESQEALEQQVKEQEKVIVAQQTERPLLQQQITLDKEDEAEEASIEDGDTRMVEHHHHKHRSLLNNDDRGLDIIEANLRRVHDTFFEEYQNSMVLPTGSRVAELKGEKSPKKPRLEGIVPDVADIMPRIKSEVLATCVIVFSGIIPLGMDVEHSDFALWIKSFGAQISLNVDHRTTHVIANPDRKTSKVKKAARILHEGGNIQIVTAEWMFQCCTRWDHVDEEPYYIDVSSERESPAPLDALETASVDNPAADEVADEVVQSPVLENLEDAEWTEMNQELDEFMGESDDTESASASDTESVRSVASTHSESTKDPTSAAGSASALNKIKRKRKRNTSEPPSEADDSDASTTSTSRLQRRKRRTLDRVTALTNVVNADKSSGLPSPETTGPEEELGADRESFDTGVKKDTAAADDDDDEVFDPQGEGADLAEDHDQDLEDDLLAAFEADEE